MENNFCIPEVQLRQDFGLEMLNFDVPILESSKLVIS